MPLFSGLTSRLRCDSLPNGLSICGYLPTIVAGMNLSLVDAGAPLLAVPQFTLAADISRGRRPAFSAAMPAAQAAPLYLELLSSLREWVKDLHSGRFGADMQVASINDGPVSFILDSGPERV